MTNRNLRQRISERFDHWHLCYELLFRGWYPGRDVWAKLTLPDGLDVFLAARRILSEFGMLKFGDSTDWTILDPSRVYDLRKSMDALIQAIGVKLYPIGITYVQEEDYLLTDENDIIYRLDVTEFDSSVSFSIRPLATNIEDALAILMRLRCGTRRRRSRMESSGLRGKKWQVEIPIA